MTNPKSLVRDQQDNAPWKYHGSLKPLVFVYNGGVGSECSMSYSGKKGERIEGRG